MSMGRTIGKLLSSVEMSWPIEIPQALCVGAAGNILSHSTVHSI